jgi:hypothetical protein
VAQTEVRTCPYCKEEIKPDATICKHCRSQLTPEGPTHGGTCPYCKEAIHAEAIKCRHCGSMVGPGSVKERGGCGGCGVSQPASVPQIGFNALIGPTAISGLEMPPASLGSTARASKCGPCFAANVTDRFGHVVGSGLRECCWEFQVPYGPIIRSCWWEICGPAPSLGTVFV